MNYIQIDKTSISNGVGFRVVLWCAGCTQRCQECFNPETWDFNAGQPFDKSTKEYLFEKLNKPYIRGITFSGGHPLEYKNLSSVYDLVKEIKERLPAKDIWLYTGYTLTVNDFNVETDVSWDNGLLRNSILAMCDVVVDGPYIKNQRDLTLAFRGSTNQRVIDVKETLEHQEIVLWNG